MSTKDVLDETMDTIEKTLDVMEGAEQAVDCTDLLARRTRVSLAIGITLGAAAGGSLAWFLTKRHYKFKYETLAEQEIAEAKAFYNRLAKQELGASVESNDRDAQLSESGAAAAEALVKYKGNVADDEDSLDIEESVEVEVTPQQPIRSNIFEDRRPIDDAWDQDAEDLYRATIGEGEPYIICDKEFLENENEYEQKSLTYFAEDDVLVDESDKPIELIDRVVGEENLIHFGKGTMDNRRLLVRNDRLSMDFEVLKRDGSYSKEVLGLQHSDGPRVRKMRRDIE